jgi:hypothetical protein
MGASDSCEFLHLNNHWRKAQGFALDKDYHFGAGAHLLSTKVLIFHFLLELKTKVHMLYKNNVIVTVCKFS